jgi:hypothetical protein
MKKTLFTLMLTSSTLVFAHGSIAQQAANAVDTAAAMFTAKQSKEVQKDVLALTATKTGHEKFLVVITLQNKTTNFSYACEEDETVEPVEWNCTEQN